MSDSCHNDPTLPGNDPSSQTVTNTPGMVYVPMPDLTKRPINIPTVWLQPQLQSQPGPFDRIEAKLDRIIDLLEILTNPMYHFGGAKDLGEPTL